MFEKALDSHESLCQHKNIHFALCHFAPARQWQKDDQTRSILVCESGCCILPHALDTEWRTCQLVGSARVNCQNCWNTWGVVGGFRIVRVAMTLRDRFNCCFTARSTAASTDVSLLIMQRLLLFLSPTIHENVVLKCAALSSEWLTTVAFGHAQTCGRMVGAADCAAFECRSCSEFQVEFTVNRTDSAQDHCHLVVTGRSVPQFCVFGCRSSTTVGPTNLHQLHASCWSLPFWLFQQIDMCTCFRRSGWFRVVAVCFACCSVAAWGLALSDCWLSVFDHWGSNLWPFRRFPHAQHPAWIRNALCPFTPARLWQKDDWTRPIPSSAWIGALPFSRCNLQEIQLWMIMRFLIPTPKHKKITLRHARCCQQSSFQQMIQVRRCQEDVTGIFQLWCADCLTLASNSALS